MKPGFDTATRHSALGAFGFAFKWYLLIFINILVPLDFLYRSGSLFNAYSTLQLIKTLSSIVIFFTVITLAISCISCVLALLSNKIRHHGAEFVNKANATVGLLLAAIIFSDYIWKWIKAVFDKSLPNVHSNNLRILCYCLLLIILISAIVLLWKVFKNKVYLEIKSFSEILFKINTIVVVFCLFYAAAMSIYNSPDPNGNQLAASIHSNKPLKPQRNIIIITFDALAASHTSLHGYFRQTTPNLTKLGQESYVFDNMYSSCNWTLPSLTSLMTGKYPANHRVNEYISYLRDEISKQNLPFLLKKLGYETALVWGNELASPFRTNLKGIDKILPGLSTERYLIYLLGLGANPWLDMMINDSLGYQIRTDLRNAMIPSRTADVLGQLKQASFAQATELLADLREPFFLWVHVFPPHGPYLPGRGFLYSILKEKVFDSVEAYATSYVPASYPPEYQTQVNQLLMRYDEYIGYVDHEFGEFLSFLREKGLLDSSVLVVSSDHGQMFERGWFSHGGPYLYQPLINVPLIMHLPGQTRGQRLGANVNHVDIPPTILDLLGQTPPDWMDGRSFKQALTDNNFNTGAKFSMELGFTNTPSGIKTRSIAAIKGNYKLIKYLDWQRSELYNLKDDPREQNNLIASKPENLSTLQKEIDHILAKY